MACPGRVRIDSSFPEHSSHLIRSRFPVISGFRVSWDSRRKPGERVLRVWLLKEAEGNEHGRHSPSGYSTPKLVDGDPIERTKDKKYKIVTREYMAQGHDGFTALKGTKYLVDDEVGQMMSTIVRKYLLGKSFPFFQSKCLTEIILEVRIS